MSNKIQIKPEDVKCEMYSSNPFGGFSHMIPNGVKFTHIATGITTSCDSERSQFRNHFIAFTELEEKLRANAALEKMAENARELGLNYELESNMKSIPNWQPIETAPKDNSRLLYLARFNEEGRLVELDFDGVWEYWQESWELAHINGYYWCSNSGIEEPTHWAYQDEPLPTESKKLEPTAEMIDAALKAACMFSTVESHKDMKKAIAAALALIGK